MTDTPSAAPVRGELAVATDRARERARTSAPAAISARTTAGWRCDTAHISAVCPALVSRAFTSAPWASSAVAAPALPVRAAVIRAVSPPRSAAFGSAPAASRRRTSGALPFSHAR